MNCCLTLTRCSKQPDGPPCSVTWCNNKRQPQDYEKRVEVVTLDIIKDKSSMTQVDAAGYKSEKAKRGPLDKQDWR